MPSASGCRGALDYGFNCATWDRPGPWVALGLSVITATLAATPRRAVHVAGSGLVAALFVFLVASYTQTL